jgi:hypothetical protein
MTSALDPSALLAHILVLEQRLRRVRFFVAILSLAIVVFTTLALKQRPADTLEGERPVLHGADGGYAEIQMPAPGRLQVRVHSLTLKPDSRGSIWMAGSGAGLELVGGRPPMLLLTDAAGGEVLRLGPGVRPLRP